MLKQTFKDVLQKVVESSVRTCDFCNKQMKVGMWEVNETTVSCRLGERYPEGGSSTELDVDMCSDCFQGKLIPWISSQGVSMRETESDW